MKLNQSFLLFSRYRDNERAARPTTPTITTAPRSTAEKSATINVTVNPKSISTVGAISAVPTKSVAPKVSKKIDMGAALNFGRTELGINSPTHRNTHAEEDLFGTADVLASSSAAVADKNDLLDDIFKTCSSTGDAAVPAAQVDDDEFFNPRDDENQEFGDFASAFGTTAAATPAATALPSAVPVTANVVPAKKDEFADFSSAFTAAPNPTPAATNNAEILFGAVPLANPLASNPISSSGVGADLLSDLDGLSLGAPIPNGECLLFSFFTLFAVGELAGSINCSLLLSSSITPIETF